MPGGGCAFGYVRTGPFAVGKRVSESSISLLWRKYKKTLDRNGKLVYNDIIQRKRKSDNMQRLGRDAVLKAFHRITIVTGHYGTGKTEFAVNLALKLAEEGGPVMLADLDIVNPYFRSRERRPLLEEAGVRVISSSQACSDADVPALPAELLAILENRDVRGVLDIGGDPVGARVLARFQPRIVQEDYQLVYVLNANRPEVRTAESAAAYLRGIEQVTGLKCSALVNNTHLCRETTAEEIRKGAALAEEVSEMTGLPVLCHTAERKFLPALSDLTVFPVEIYMKKPWE